MDDKGGQNPGVVEPGDDKSGVNAGGVTPGVTEPGNDKSAKASPASATPSSEVLMQGKSKATIAGFPAEFSVKFEQRFDRTKFEAEASNLNLDAGTKLSVCFGTKLLGTLTISALKLGELELDSRKGDTVPAFVGGEEIGLVNGDCTKAALIKATLGSAAAASSSAAPVVQSDTVIESTGRKVIQGFEAEFHVRLEHRPGRDKFHAEVEGLNLGAGIRLDVCFGGKGLGELFLDAVSFGEMELDSRFSAVAIPALKSGDVVELRQGGCGGTLILSATMGAAAPPADAAQGALHTMLGGETKKVIETFEAEFSVKFDRLGDRRKAEAEVSNLNLPAATHLSVCLAGTAMGDVVLNTIHFGEFELDTRNGDIVPAAKAGDLVELHRQGCGSELLMSVSLSLVP